MIVFHGSDRIIESPDILEPNRALDFGKGFYTTINEQQAESFARKVQDRLHSENAVVNVYDADMDSIRQSLRCIWFYEADETWLDYVSNNRGGIITQECDVVFGPVANDDVFRTFAAFQAGLLTKSETIARLKVKQLYNQMTFKNKQSLNYLHFITSYSLWLNKNKSNLPPPYS